MSELIERMRSAMADMMLPKVPPKLRLFVPPAHYAKGETWVREAYQVGPDVEIVESKPLPAPLTFREQ